MIYNNKDMLATKRLKKHLYRNLVSLGMVLYAHIIQLTSVNEVKEKDRNLIRFVDPNVLGVEGRVYSDLQIYCNCSFFDLNYTK